jgi:hypothetical protein
MPMDFVFYPRHEHGCPHLGHGVSFCSLRAARWAAAYVAATICSTANRGGRFKPALRTIHPVHPSIRGHPSNEQGARGHASQVTSTQKGRVKLILGGPQIRQGRKLPIDHGTVFIYALDAVTETQTSPRYQASDYGSRFPDWSIVVR